MRGIRIRFRNEIFNIACHFQTSIMCYQRFGRFYLQVSGLELDKIVHDWIDEKIGVEEYIEFEIIDMEKYQPSEPRKKRDAFIESPLKESELDDMYAQKLAKFFAIEEYLKKEGLI